MMIEPTITKFENVMIIDDNVIDLYIASRMITKNNFGNNVIAYTKAQEALDYLQDNQNNELALPQIIFVDIYMPIMSGFDFLKFYNELPEKLKNYCHVYVLSSTIDDYDIIRASTDVNIISFQVKPITKDFLDKIN
ncbi:response regulator [Flavobacterium sp.]|jgi:CheY-like chemotaxis protein|uniref:response regulator n=1 Tax=Flavobacterium sp. TaxID=239 RepID=UPI000ED326C8|nr:response regulator [Flavobacterium sp.]HCQ13854.1 response regulator [Flavobacterium sp.]